MPSIVRVEYSKANVRYDIKHSFYLYFESRKGAEKWLKDNSFEDSTSHFWKGKPKTFVFQGEMVVASSLSAFIDSVFGEKDIVFH
jgi:hypothetical protein